MDFAGVLEAGSDLVMTPFDGRDVVLGDVGPTMFLRHVSQGRVSEGLAFALIRGEVEQAFRQPFRRRPFQLGALSSSII